MKQANGAACVLVSLALVVLFSACGSNDNALAPQFEPEVVNLPDSFSFQTTGITNVSQVLVYDWENTGVSANIDQSCSISEGSATLVVTDSSGSTVYTKDLAEDGSFQTGNGPPGTWTVRVSLLNTSGTLNFSVEKRTP